MPDGISPDRRRGQLAVGAGVVLWSAGNLVVRGTDLSGPQVAFWRYVIAAVIYSVIHRIFVGPLRWADFRAAALTGLAIAIEIAAFFAAIKTTTVANVTVIGSLVPLLLFGVAAVRFGERVTRRMLAATVAGLGGVALVVWGSSDAATWSPAGDGLAVLALVFFAAYFTFAKIARTQMGAFTLQTHSLLIGVPVLAAITIGETGGLAPPTGWQWLYPLGLVALPSTGHLLVNWAHNRVTLTFTSLMTLVVPVLSVLGAWLLFSEVVTVLQAVGIVITLVVLSVAVIENNRNENPNLVEADAAN